MRTFIVMSLTVLAMFGGAAPPFRSGDPAIANLHRTPDPALVLRQDMRKLWSDHVIWTRGYIVAAVGDQPDQAAAASRLMKNQEDIGGAVAVYYGKPAGDKLTALLKEHIQIAVDLV